ncbi:MAG: glycosyltransferase [Paracoccus sp. (in: a-proteobacteria)]|nr:glycosyltransferase [Paracoccus sp. (in: a-proteobacteria)]
MAQVFIALALYDGAAHLAEQLGSIAAQTHRDWRLVISDDGSRDNGPAIAQRFAATRPKGQVTLVDGPGQGATANFLTMAGGVRPGEYLAFSDQDDVWQPDRLSRAVAAMGPEPGLAVYGSRTTICDGALRPLAGSARYSGPFDFANALVQCVIGGNTALLSPKAAALYARAAPAAIAAGIEAHDWFAYLLVSGAGGRVIRDDAETVLYRQHEGNLKGRNDTFRAMAERLRGLFGGDYGDWLAANNAALAACREMLTDENAALLDRFAQALRRPGPLAAKELASMGLRRQTRATTVALYLAALTGRLRRG